MFAGHYLAPPDTFEIYLILKFCQDISKKFRGTNLISAVKRGGTTQVRQPLNDESLSINFFSKAFFYHDMIKKRPFKFSTWVIIIWRKGLLFRILQFFLLAQVSLRTIIVSLIEKIPDFAEATAVTTV